MSDALNKAAGCSDNAPERRISLRLNILANYAGRAYSLCANYFFIPFYIAILGIEYYGLIAFYAILQAITSIADVGLSATFSRQAAREKDSAKLAGMLSTAERILLLATTAFALVILVFAGWFAEHWINSAGTLKPEEMIMPLRLMALMLIPQLLFTLYSAGLLGLQYQVGANVLQALFITARAGMVIPIVQWRPDLTLFFGWQAVVTMVFAIAARALLLRRMQVNAFSLLTYDFSVLHPHLKYAGGVLAITAISTVNTQLDKILVSRFFSIADFGYYNVASTLAQLPLAVAMPIGVAFFPRLVSSITNSDGADSAFGNYTRLVAMVSGLGSIGLALFAPEILHLWLHARVPEIVPHVAATLAIGSLFLCLNTPTYYLCLAHGRSWLVVGASLATLAVSLPCLVLGIHFYGLWGGALAWLLLNVVNLVVLITAMKMARITLSIRDFIRGTMFPVSITTLLLLAARWIANISASGAYLSCLIAAVAGLTSLGIVAARNRKRFGVLDKPTLC